MKLFLTSNLGGTRFIDGKETFLPINNKNHILKNLQESIKKFDRITYIVSTPDRHDINDYYASQTFESFEHSGLVFKEKIVLDDRIKDNYEEILLNSDVIFLSGGKTYYQIAFFEELNLKEILNDYEGVLIGMSAGAMNCSETVITPPEEPSEIGRFMQWEGLGYTPLNLEPHFVPKVQERIDLLLRDVLLGMSHDYQFLGLCDESYILINEEGSTLYGEAYTIEGGVITKINKHGNTKKI